MGQSASWPWWQVERDRFGVMFSGPLEVGEMIEVVSAEKCRGDIQRIHDMDDYIERLEAAARELVKLAEGYHDYILKITGSVDGFAVIERAKKVLDG